MNNYKSVRKRLFTNSEVELKSEKIELGVGQDVLKAVETLEKAVDKLVLIEDQAKTVGKKYEDEQLKAYTNMLDRQEKLFSQMDKLTSVNKDSKSLIQKAEKAAKELGVDVNDIKGIKQLKDLSANYSAEFTGVRSEIKKIETITI